MHKILSLTHTNPLVDSRILRTVQVQTKIGVPHLVVGISRDNYKAVVRNNFELVTVNSKKLKQIIPEKLQVSRVIPNVINFIIFLELFFKISIKGIKYRPEIIHAHDFYVLPIAVLIKIFCNSKIIYDAHELESETTHRSKKMRILVNFIEKMCLRKINFFITVSPSILDWYVEKYHFKNSEIILNSPVIDKIMTGKKGSNYFREKYSLPSDTTIYLYLGKLALGRGIHTILDAFTKISPKFIVIFMGAGPLETEIQVLAEKHTNIFLHEQVPHNTVTQISSCADFGLCLIEGVSKSYEYCLPNKLFESIFSGLPIIVSNLPDMRNLVQKYGVGICIDNSSEKLIQTINSVKVSDFDGRLFEFDSLVELSWEFQAQKLERIYTSLFTSTS